MNNFMPSSPASQATSSVPSTAFTPPDEIINETLISLFYLTSEGGFMGKDTRIVNHREQDGKVQIELVINGYSFWMDAKEISLRLNQMQQRRLMSDRTIYFISDSNGKFRCNHRIKSWSDMRLEQYQEMSGRYAQ
ncbi:hypothetical protein [Citrobacter sp. Cpo126]|uniref:hypothetical protein n=1 Tax=Citrobacter sp. Cpo126 TaxID=2985148 RepID=UPI00257910E9|nr:hypothetical protein [Citrobacter sp. Cpo126]MDM2773327.1 hypothetical protein [Citrobacter sp. Cpo126]